MCRGALSGVDVTSPNVKKGATVKCERQSRQTRIPAKKQNRFTLGSCPRTVIEPDRTSLSPLTHGSESTFPEPDGLMVQITSPFMMPRETPFDTSGSQDTFWAFRIETIGWPEVEVMVSPRTCDPGEWSGGQRESS